MQRIFERRTFKLGAYVVHQQPRFYAPCWPQYVVMRGERVVGYSFSCPDAEQCEAIERFSALGRYVEAAPIKRYDYRLKKRK